MNERNIGRNGKQNKERTKYARTEESK
jgi:hypothetical protein